MDKYIVFGIIISLLFFSIVIIFCLFLGKLYIKKIKEHNEKQLAFHKTLNETIIETQEQVLNNISQDLHDDAGQQLTYINFQLENLKLDSPELQETLSPISQSVGQLSQSIRSISHALNNQLLLQQDLIKAIATEVERLQKNTKVVLTFAMEETPKKKFSVNEKIFIYRIFQECLNNSFKHAKATEVNIQINTGMGFEMQITDNGKGFDLTEAANKKSMGLLNMKNRAESIDYTLDITAAPGKGTTVLLTQNKTS